MGISHPNTPHLYVIHSALVLPPSFVPEVGVNKKGGIPIGVSTIERSQPKGVKPKIRWRKLRMGYTVV